MFHNGAQGRDLSLRTNQNTDCLARSRSAPLRRYVSLSPITIESGPTSGWLLVDGNPASFIHCEQSAPV
jgi:hypothetical protein